MFDKIIALKNRIVGRVERLPKDIDYVADAGLPYDEDSVRPISYAENGDAMVCPKFMRLNTAYGFKSKGMDLAVVTPDGNILRIYFFTEKR